MSHDIVIRGGLVVDGSGRAPFPADVAIAGDRITSVGPGAGPGQREIDARGLVVTPGSSTSTPTWTRRSAGTRPAPPSAGTA